MYNSLLHPKNKSPKTSDINNTQVISDTKEIAFVENLKDFLTSKFGPTFAEYHIIKMVNTIHECLEKQSDIKENVLRSIYDRMMTEIEEKTGVKSPVALYDPEQVRIYAMFKEFFLSVSTVCKSQLKKQGVDSLLLVSHRLNLRFDPVPIYD